jgi:hypothetical protein
MASGVRKLSELLGDGSIADLGSDKLRVFVSYSRDDIELADQIIAVLGPCGFDPVIDRHGIAGGEEWKSRLGNLILEADTVVFLLSPSSARSDVCAWEVEEAARLGKRIIPVVCREMEGAEPPARLRNLNYIYFYSDPKAPSSGFGTGLGHLISALRSDLGWLREHTRLLQRATEWRAGGRAASRLLSGADIAQAKEWLSRRPKGAADPTALHHEYIRASEQAELQRANAEFKRLEEINLAQIEKANALLEKETVLRQQGRLRNVAAVALLAGAVLAGSQWWRAEGEKRQAVQARQEAQEREQEAEQALERVRSLIFRAKVQEQTISRDRNLMANLEDAVSKLKTENSELATARQKLSETAQELELQKQETKKERAAAQKEKAAVLHATRSLEEADKRILALSQQLRDTIKEAKEREQEAEARTKELSARLNAALAKNLELLRRVSKR